VYGMNAEAVRYIEKKLQGESQKQWSAVDTKMALEKLEKMMPTDLKERRKYEDLAEWYTMNAGKHGWHQQYDRGCLSKEGMNEWMGSWYERIGSILVYGSRWWMGPKATSDSALIAPRLEVHEYVIKQIREQLNELRKDVETKAGKQPSNAVKF
jgi:hypothetical protein